MTRRWKEFRQRDIKQRTLNRGPAGTTASLKFLIYGNSPKALILGLLNSQVE